MERSPSPTAANGRDAGGRFAAGNSLARGNPFARRVAELRSALFDTVQPGDLRAVVATLVANAKAGDVAAAKELLQRLLGPPVSDDLLERIEAIERQLAATAAEIGEAS